jgi:hypothetical protein
MKLSVSAAAVQELAIVKIDGVRAADWFVDNMHF